MPNFAQTLGNQSSLSKREPSLGEELSLRLIHLKPSQQWTFTNQGFCFVFPKHGLGQYVSGTVAHALEPGATLVVGDGIGGMLRPNQGSELSFWIFFMRFEHLFPLFTSREVSQLKRVTHVFKQARLYPARLDLSKKSFNLVREVTGQFDLHHRSQLLRVAAGYLTEEFQHARSEQTVPTGPEERITEVFRKMPSDQFLNLPVGELALQFGCSRRHLNRLFHQHLGYSVAALRMEMRMLRAVSLLRNPQMKVINVAEESGFNHLGLFNTCFKRRFGHSPGEWRKKNATQQDDEVTPRQEITDCLLRAKGLLPVNGQNDRTIATLKNERSDKLNEPELPSEIDSPACSGSGEASPEVACAGSAKSHSN